MKFNKKLGAAVIVALFCFSFLPVLTSHIVKAQSSSNVLFSDNFDTNQPNSQFVLGTYDNLNSTTYNSATHSLQVSGESIAYTNSYATFSATTGQIYIQLFFMSPNDGTGVSNWVAELTGNNGNTWFEILQDSDNGLEFFIGDNTYHPATPVFLTPNVWQNITLSLYLDPSQGSNSYVSLWLNGQEIITNQNMPQVTGYQIDTIIFATSIESQTNYYDDVIIGTQSSYTPSPTPTPTPTPTPYPIITLTPTPINTTPNPTSTSKSSPTSTSTSSTKSTLTPTPASTHTATNTKTSMVIFSVVDWLIVIAVIIIALILVVLVGYRRRRRKPNTQETEKTYLGTF